MSTQASSRSLEQFLHGRRLLRKELPFSENVLETYESKGQLNKEPALLTTNGECLCDRCGNKNAQLFFSHPCARCNRDCTYCRHCLSLGKVMSCDYLYSWTETVTPDPCNIQSSLIWDGELSSGQMKASEAVSEAIQTKETLLVWAVCGAGKTEVLFQGLEHAFSKGDRVLLATPRTDVVKELAPRLKQAFPSVSIAALYGGSENQDPAAPFIIATTHQVMRYYRAFDVVIIDEVDAFPYSFDKSLQYAVAQAKKPTSATIYLSATPSVTSNLNVIKIPKRYHGFPLPEPTFSWCGHWKKALQKQKLPRNVLNWLTTRKEKPVFLFVPSINVLEQISTALEKEGLPHKAVHAKNPGRHQSLEAFRKGELKLLVTTTILERGVTIANLDVAVLGAEEDVFTEAALVQIAGRVGRSKDYPQGDICFFHYGKTTAMRAALNHIKQMNKEGFL
ncbi:DEAD/DEAH box helicase [Bacillus solitudinis]|uniref:DEAD/DEAH box helicase n=1 Tax=Bacillus solitudinis TaxID=2014074 RepID=UPI000C23C349|nr:DEAD/DEAH box helicase [Bacillus solitudinis]